MKVRFLREVCAILTPLSRVNEVQVIGNIRQRALRWLYAIQRRIIVTIGLDSRDVLRGSSLYTIYIYVTWIKSLHTP
jgi:hypothetical protein